MKNKLKINLKDRDTLLKLAIIIVVVLIFIYFIISSVIKINEKNDENKANKDGKANLHYSTSEYSSLKELLSSYDCGYIGEATVDKVLEIYVSFTKDLYTDKTSNENYFMGIVSAVADYENYSSFRLIDDSRNIKIYVKCQNGVIGEVEINGDENYYLTHDSTINSEKEKENLSEIQANSSELKDLIENNWNPTKVDFGTKDSSCNGYDIYFDEGIEYKVVGRTVYNIRFTEKYKNEVAGGLGVNVSTDDVVDVFGEPTFISGESLYGYIGDNFYIFFDFSNKEISIYPNTKISEADEDSFIDLINKMNETSDIKQFSMDLTSLWKDYDIYNFDSNYVDLEYTLKGVKLTISVSSLKNGIYIYQNYNGNLSKMNELKNVYIQNTDMIFEAQKKLTQSEQLGRIEQGDNYEEMLKTYGEKFAVRFTKNIGSNEKGYRGVVFYCRDKEYPDTELDSRTVVSSFKWYDDYNFVYSVDNDGIYVFNCINHKNNKIADIDGEIEINSAEDEKIIYNETQEINLQIQ